ncbi:MAG: Lrp/AsnC family transcriptional regulator [Deltaproteobacteria bacterium]|nr:Lrp/AsnC family transcriptional regulator [Deltaproteobacteria bacterium]MBW2053164.1 Lrp/AsnC family transcriptional regulator [Deltaproteobacteria bacterium]MBW2142140.1 Lrp/AsnC family transcriptional regulator [Deltaproteobacteria bacterium]MBW2324625.1 Lrp/AsnC family transcriptional regulator [Deltaproteobacteria bacterium]
MTLDNMDKALINLLSIDGRMPTGEIANRLDVTNPTVRTRMRALISSGVLKIAGLVDLFKIENLTIALVAMNIEKHQQLDQKLQQISDLNLVHWAAIVTGRYDILAEVISSNGMTGLYRFLTVEIPKVGGILSSESFMIMKAKRKWVLLPERLRDWRNDAGRSAKGNKK